jgi:hypothetical protein
MDNIGVRGLFKRCDSEILFFIILFLLLFYDDGRYGRYDY